MSSKHTLRFIFGFGFHAVAGFEKVRLVRLRDSSSPGAMRARRGIAARYIKANSSRKGSRPRSFGPFPVSDTFSKIRVLTEEQAKAYIAMLTSTASLKGEVAPASIFDFSLAVEAAKELAQKK